MRTDGPALGAHRQHVVDRQEAVAGLAIPVDARAAEPGRHDEQRALEAVALDDLLAARHRGGGRVPLRRQAVVEGDQEGRPVGQVDVDRTEQEIVAGLPGSFGHVVLLRDAHRGGRIHAELPPHRQLLGRRHGQEYPVVGRVDGAMPAQLMRAPGARDGKREVECAPLRVAGPDARREPRARAFRDHAGHLGQDRLLCERCGHAVGHPQDRGRRRAFGGAGRDDSGAGGDLRLGPLEDFRSVDARAGVRRRSAGPGRHRAGVGEAAAAAIATATASATAAGRQAGHACAQDHDFSPCHHRYPSLSSTAGPWTPCRACRARIWKSSDSGDEDTHRADAEFAQGQTRNHHRQPAAR